MDTQEKELVILESIYQHDDNVRQRELAEIVGMSLGMTNAVLKRLVQKGFLTIRKINNRNILYAVTPKGVEQITKKSYKYVKRTIKHIVDYKLIIEELIQSIKNNGYSNLVIVGRSDIYFIIEHFCWKYQIDIIKERQIPLDCFYLYSENYIPDTDDTRKENTVFLQELLLRE